MLTGKEVALIYETLLSSPGMQDTVKIPMTISRKLVLLLSAVIENGLQVRPDSPGWLTEAMTGPARQQLNELATDILQRGGLTEVAERLSTLQAK